MPPARPEKRRRPRDDSDKPGKSRDSTADSSKRRKADGAADVKEPTRDRGKAAAAAAASSEVGRGAPGREEPAVPPQELFSAGMADCDALRTVVQKMHAQPAGKATATLKELVTSGLLLVTDIKRVVRMSHRNWKDAEEETMAARALVDARYLQLQNVMFEKMHVLNDIERCEQFRSRHHDIDLEPASTEHETAASGDAHKLMLLRLEAELKDRRELLAEHERLKEARAEAERSLNAKRDQLRELPQLLQDVLASAKPVVDYFKVAESEGVSPVGDGPTYLPTPLYVLFSCLDDYRELSSCEFSVTVTGDLKAAKDPAMLKLWEGKAVEADDDAMLVDEVRGRRKGGREADSAEAQTKEAHRRVLRKHPLSVELKVGDLVVKFWYLLELRVVTVTSTTKNSDVDDGVLQYMYPNDTGLQLPTEASALKMTKLRMKPYAEYAPKLGRPFKWAQLVSGCPVSGGAAGPTVESRQRRRNILRVVQDIVAHTAAVKALASQLNKLGKHQISIRPEVPIEVERALFPLPAVSTLASWALTSDENELSTFEGKLTRGDATLHFSVVVSKVYPMVPPEFSLVVPGQGDDDMAYVDPNYRAIEREINIHFDELTAKASPNMLLMLQIRRLVMCFDICCECDAVEAGEQQTAGKLFERAARGKDRLRPFVFDSTLGFFVHRERL